MTKIKNTTAYVIKTPLALTDYAIGTNSVDAGVGMAKGQSISMQLSDIREAVIAGLSPEIGGTLKITELEYTGVLTSPAAVANALDPVYIVSQYEVLVFNVNGNKYLLKLQDVTIGDGETDITDADFITIVAVKSLGDGTAVMAGYNADGEIEFRALKSTGLDISVSSGNIIIESKAGTSVGDAGVDIYKGLNATSKLHEIRKAKSVGLDVTIDGDAVKFESKAGANLGATGTGVYKGLNATTKIHEFFKLSFPDNVVTLVDDVIIVALPVDTSDIKFYVNANYAGGNSNGSLAAPYVTLAEAFDAFRGTIGTDINPEFGGVATIELLSDVTVAAAGATSMDYLSINNLKLKGNGFSITYQGSQDYFISTDYLVNYTGAKNVNGTLVNPVTMSFENVEIISETQHKIVNHLNYKSPSVSTIQNDSSLYFTNCSIIDKAYLVDTGSYIDTGKTLAGATVFAQNSLPKDLYMVKNKNVNWYGEGAFNMTDCKLVGSSSTILYNVDSSMTIQGHQMDFNPLYANYKDTTGTDPNKVYNPIEGVYFILNESINTAVKANTYLRIDNFKEFTQEALSGGSIIGGADAFYRGVGATILNVNDGYFYSEKFNNLIQLTSVDSGVVVTNFDCSNVISVDATYGAFKYTGAPPATDPVYVYMEGSNINNVKNWTTLQFARPNANNAIVNGAIFSILGGFANNAAALAGGLVPGNLYFNSSTSIATRVIP